MNSLNRIIDKLENVKETGDQTFTARCPAHDDSRNSLSVRLSDDQTCLIHCFAGCDTRDVVSAMGLTMSDLFPPKEKKAKNQSGKIVATYDYVNEDNVLIYQVVRYDPKSFRQRRPGPNESWLYDLKGVSPLLYRLPDLKRRITEPIFLVEGEKDVNSLHAIGLLATSASGGAAKKWDVGFTPHFAGRDVIIIPDNDEPGQKYGQSVAQALSGVASSVKILTIPNMPIKGDVSDYLGLMCGDRESLLEIVRNTALWSPTTAKEPEQEVFLECTDLGNARRFVRDHKVDTRFCPQRSQWLHWNGQKWMADEDGQIMRKDRKSVV